MIGYIAGAVSLLVFLIFYALGIEAGFVSLLAFLGFLFIGLGIFFPR